mgnify:CR=1 FL=1
MYSNDLFRISIRQVIRRTKKLIAITGAIALGSAGLIFVLTMGDEVKQRVNRDLVQLSQATIIKCIYDRATTAQDMLRRPPWFKDETVKELRSIQGVDAVSLSSDTGVTTYIDEDVATFIVRGCDADYWEIYRYLEVEGRFFTAAEDESGDRVCVIGQRLAETLFGTADVVGQDLPIQSNLFTIIGVLSHRTADHRTDWVFVPLSSAQMRLAKVEKPSIMYIMAANWELVSELEPLIKEIIAKHQEDRGLEIQVAWGPLNSARRIMLFVEIFIYFTLGVILLLGVFGISNTMTTQVKARTREIGLKKAIGATDRDILKQFLLESIFICMAGSFVGASLGFGVVILASHLMGTPIPYEFTALCSSVSLSLSVFTGIAAGWLPATSASRMDVVMALRYE